MKVTGLFNMHRHHDAIMLVKKEGVVVSEVVCSMLGHKEDVVVQMLG